MASTIFAVSGSDDFSKRRHVERMVSKQRTDGWDVQFVDGSDGPSFTRSASQSVGGLGDDRPVLLVVDNPEKAPIQVLESRMSNPIDWLTILLVVDGDPKGNTKFGKFVLALDKKSHTSMQLPDKKWEMPKFASEFCVAEVKKCGKSISEELSNAIVKVSGTDIGFLSFEVQKMVMHADSRGSNTLSIDDVRASLAPIGEVSFDGVKDALVSRNTKSLTQALIRIKRATKDPVMPLCGFLDTILLGYKSEKEGKASFGWLHLTTMTGRGFDSEKISSELGINSWRCKNILIPEVARWNSADVIKAIRAVSTARRVVLNGSIDPWTLLVSSLTEVCGNIK